MPSTRVYHRFTVDEYEQMVATGILTEQDRVELIRGEILAKMTIGDPHIACVLRLNWLLSQLAAGRALVSIQNPIRLSDSMPEPDVALLRPRADFYRSGKPRPPDIFLVIEVADTSLDFDRETKRSLCAEAGIVEYWIANLVDQCVEVHRQPRPDGSYAVVQIARPGQQIEIEALPGVIVSVDQLM